MENGRCADGARGRSGEGKRKAEGDEPRVFGAAIVLPATNLIIMPLALSALVARRPCACAHQTASRGYSAAQCSINTTETTVPEIQTPYLCPQQRKGGESRPELI